MTLIKSISGIRGTIGGSIGQNLTPVDIVEFTSAYGVLIHRSKAPNKIILGRDGRITGQAVEQLVATTLIMMGIDVITLGLSTTPTVEMAVVEHQAGGGIIITASHNPKEWNALKFLNHHGEFISHELGSELLDIARNRTLQYASVDSMGQLTSIDGTISAHINAILDLELVRTRLIRNHKYHIVVDCINSTGAISIPPLLDALDCTYTLINHEINGQFAHNPEPLADNLADLIKSVVAEHADLGIAVDPDVDRLAFVDEKGQYCGEEYTLVMIADWVLANDPGPTVSNLSSTYALREVTEKHGQEYYAAPVGEVNVVNKMKAQGAVIGGEGNGGVIFPKLHYGRDALAGIALLLSALADKTITLSQYRSHFPTYFMIKDKINLSEDLDVDRLLSHVASAHSHLEVDTQDGVKIYFDSGWTHLRKSNTEPIIRLYAEAKSIGKAQGYVDSIKKTIKESI